MSSAGSRRRTDSFNLDDLLEDIDEATAPTPEGGRYVPHPPTQKSPINKHNPKNKFAVNKSPCVSPRDQPASHHPYASGSGGAFAIESRSGGIASPDFNAIIPPRSPVNHQSQPKQLFGGDSHAAAAAAGCKSRRTEKESDDNSLDNLLNMLENHTPEKKNHGPIGAAAFSPTVKLAEVSPMQQVAFSADMAKNAQQSYAQFGFSTKLAFADNTEQQQQQQISNSNVGKNLQNGCGPLPLRRAGSGFDDSPADSPVTVQQPRFSPRQSSSRNSFDEDDDEDSNHLALANILKGGQGPAKSSPSSMACNKPKSTTDVWSLGNSSNSGSSALNSSTAIAPSIGGGKARCTRVMLGGTNVPRGRKSSAFAKFACDNLRCLKCNFRVHCFAGQRWDSSADYMFLRNTVPNEVKLRTKLQANSDAYAYCCQCTSATEACERVLTQGATEDPQWICGGH